MRVFARTFTALPAPRAPGAAARRILAGLTALALGGCALQPPAPLATRAPSPGADAALGASFSGFSPVPRAGLPANASLARDILDLAFVLESGRELDRFSRFEGPVSITMAGPVPPMAMQDLEHLLRRLRNEAGLVVSTAPGAPNRILVEFLPKPVLRAEVPNAACFVVPGVLGWRDYQRARGSGRTDWTRIAQRRVASVFIPADAPPQEVRDCLHEEISQALGPLNDLYRLSESIWNDDNFHAVLTRYDMTILRAFYAPELRSGMSRAEVMRALSAVLARLNPAGGPVQARPPDPTPRGYLAAIERALGGDAAPSRRRAAAREAVRIATSQGWTDCRAGLAWFALGRLSIDADPAAALQAFIRAGTIYRAIPGARIQAAHVDMHLAGFALSNGRAADALKIAERALEPAYEAENAALIASLHMLRAAAHEGLGHAAEARQARLDIARWARYGFGSDAMLQRRVDEMAALADAGSDRN